ncbi:hypothetical protein N7528_003430 [Penicillium herquei]|nr:hypothetical protein N7528_003430 [Penicillium herquei]
MSCPCFGKHNNSNILNSTLNTLFLLPDSQATSPRSIIQHELEKSSISGIKWSANWDLDLHQPRGLHGIWSKIHCFPKMLIGDTHNQIFSHRRYVMVKIFIQVSSMGQQVDNELEMYKYMERSSAHCGHNTIWDLYEGGSLFTGQDPEFQRYRSRAHLAEMINLLGPPPPSLITQGELSNKFFSSEGEFLNQDLLTGLVPLEQRETTLAGTAEREAFLRFMRKMLQWEPGKRSSAKELAEDEWIHSHM